MNHRWIVLSNPLGGREAAFNDWFDHIHIRDIVRLLGGGRAGAESRGIGGSRD